MTSFTYGTTTITMSQNPLAPRNFDEEQVDAVGYVSDGTPYAYDHECSIYRNESLIFPAVRWDELQTTIRFFVNILDGRYRQFTWNDRKNITRLARYKSLSYVKISYTLYQLTIGIEVVT